MSDTDDTVAADAEHVDIGGSGYSIEQLSDYRDRGRFPAIAAIDDNAECQAVLDSLDRVSAISNELLERDAARLPVDENWMRALMSTIAFEVRAGRDIPYVEPIVEPVIGLPTAETDLDLVISVPGNPERVITEGAVREIVRWAGDSVPGVLVGRVSLDAEDDGPVDVSVSISAAFGHPLTERAALVRSAVAEALVTHTPLTVGTIDVTISEIHLPESGTEAEGTGR